jgi:hypothetical protein
MSQKSARKYPDEMPASPEVSLEHTAEDAKALRRRQLDRIRSHKGRIELDIDLETLEKLRSMP